LIVEDWNAPRKRRDRLHIIAEVLAVASNGALKTQIMYKANLSFAQLNEYLSLLLDIGLLKIVKKGERTFYKTTRKGTKYIESYVEISDLLGKEKQNKSKNSPIFLSKPLW